MISDSTFDNIAGAFEETTDASLRDTAEELIARKPEIPPEVRDGETFGPYRLGPRLGRGGMGVVHKAWDTELGRWVALKLLRDASPALRLRFSRESVRLARLTHPSIVPVYRAAQHGETPYIAMAWIEGRTLDRVELSVRESLEAIRTAARAIQHAHEKGIVHRDLKPQNLMIAENGHLYVVDFGLARDAAEQPSTVDGSVLGTPAYMAPEQARGKTDEIGPHTDVYALGATLYHRVAGRAPFSAEDVPALMRRISDEEPPPIGKKLHPDIDMIIRTAMEKSPGDRYPTAGHLADDIDRFLEGEPILARPLPWWRRALRWMGRNPVLTAVVGTATPLLLVMGGALYVAYEELHAARDFVNETNRLRNLEFPELMAYRRYEEAVTALREGDPSKALRSIEFAIQLKPDIREFWTLKAEILTALGRHEEAARALEEAAKWPR